MKNIPILLSIDVEPDGREIDSATPDDWHGFEGIFDLINRIRPRLEEATNSPVNFSWFLRMDPQIEHGYGLSWWVAKRYPDAFKQLELAGDEFGLHTHSWRWDGDLQKWIVDQGNQEWVAHCLQVSFDAYRSAFGRPCHSFRFGDQWMNNETMGWLEAAGVKFDLSLEPGREARPGLYPGELHTGSWPDLTTTPRWPYRPSHDDYRKDGDAQGRRLWVIPLSTTGPVGGFEWLRRATRFAGIDLQSHHTINQLNLVSAVPLFRVMVNNLLEAGGKPYLTPVVRSDAGLHSETRDTIEQNIASILSHPRLNQFKFVTSAEAIELLT